MAAANIVVVTAGMFASSVGLLALLGSDACRAIGDRRGLLPSGSRVRRMRQCVIVRVSLRMVVAMFVHSESPAPDCDVRTFSKVISNPMAASFEGACRRMSQ